MRMYVVLVSDHFLITFAAGGLFHGMKVHTEYPKPEVK